MQISNHGSLVAFQNYLSAKPTKQIILKASNFVINNLPLMLAGAVIGGSFSFKICSALTITAVASTAIITVSAIISALCVTLILNKSSRSLSSFIPNIKNRIGKVWEIKNFQDKALVEAALHKVMDKLKSIEITIDGETRNAYEIVEREANKKNNLKDFGFQFGDLNSVIKFLGNGLCFGQSRLQLDYISQGCQLDGEAIHKLPLTHRKKVVYYQIMQYAEALLSQSKRDIMLSMSPNPEHAHYLAFKKKCMLEISEILTIPKNIRPPKITPLFSTKISPNELEEIFNQTTKDMPEHVAMGGYARLMADENTPSHAVFFSLYKDKFYIQDTISPDQGFFQFSIKTDFFEGLSKQMGLHFDAACLIIYSSDLHYGDA